jgi:hypothetical protein
VLQSNGGAAAATWVSPTSVTYNNVYSVESTGTLEASGGVDLAVPGMSMNIPIAGPSRVIVTLSLPMKAVTCFSCPLRLSYIRVHVGPFIMPMHAVTMSDGARTTFTATEHVLLGAGTYTVSIGADTVANIGETISYGSISPSHGELIVQVIPQ